MEGRTDQAYTSGSASALDDVGTPKSANTPTASDASRRQNLPAWAALATIVTGLIVAYLNGYVHQAMALGIGSGGGKNTAIGI